MSTLIQVRNLHKAYGPTVIFDDTSVDFARGDHVGVIGRNGAGKSTLLKILLAEEDIDAGTVVKNSRLVLGSLEQRTPFEADESVIAFLMRHTQREEWRCGKIAGRFQLKGELLNTPVAELPGGYQTRVGLVAMLLSEPNFLLLDEPTNYLDLRTLLLLERFLRDFKGGYLVVSHDREFLKRTCTKTLEVERGKLTLFPGDVEAYLSYKEEQVELAQRINKNIEAERKHLQSYVDRYRVRASTASRAQSKLKQLNKLETIEIAHPMSTARVKIPQVEERRGVALQCEGLAIGYPDQVVATDIRFEIERGEHVAILGDNGQGKTTFLRTIAGDLATKKGSFRWGHNLQPGYYAQHVYTALPEHLDVFTYLRQCAAQGLTDQDVLDMAGSFLFRGDLVRNQIAVLSGGERARVCLAGLLLRRQNVLLLDEPTNHLDFETVEALGEALGNYRGTIFFISHDRTFVKTIASNVVEVKDGAVNLYPGNYDTYVYQTEREVGDALRGDDGGGREEKPQKRVTDYAARKALRSRANKLRRQIAQAEERTAALEEEAREINQHFLDNPLDYSREKQTRVQEIKEALADEEAKWLEMQEELEGVEEELGE